MSAKILPLNTAGDATMDHAVVKGGRDGAWMVDAGDGVFSARRAASCLLAPAPGDRVLISRHRQGSYIIAVLESAAESSELTFDRPLAVTAPEVRVNARDDLRLSGGRTVSLTGAECEVLAARARVHAGRLNLRGEEAHADVSRLRVVAQSLDTAVDRVTHRAKQVVRWVEDVELLNIGSIVQTVRKTFTSTSTHTVLTAKKDMRVDADRIHMG